MRKRTLFFGTPEVAVPFLETLHKHTDIALVITQPDRPRGRGMIITPCPVKAKALELGLKVVSPEKVSEIEPYIQLAQADYGVAVAYGKILKQHVIDMPKLGIINIHFSLLPLFRGAAPVQHSLFAGVAESGVSAFWIDAGMDTGPIFLQAKTDVLPDYNAITLFNKLIPLGCDLLEECVKKIEDGEILKTPQIHPGAPKPSYAPMINKADTVINFIDTDAVTANNRVRGLACGPFAKAELKKEGTQEFLQILKSSLPKDKNIDDAAQPGTIISVERDSGLIVKCYKGALAIQTVRPAGKKEMNAFDYANGYKLKKGDRIFK
ncbi:methionyl-tRNA formyltransferase [Elusimicrobium posterum]|uniref:methionyl-tRNA formyltransferase n=1 Tax=Elusimicrobium posterum TaxID=3116653 RepID=UPI003C735C18